MNLQTHVSLMHPRDFIGAYPDAIEHRIVLGEVTGTALAFNTRGNILAVGCFDGSVKIIDFWTREIIRELPSQSVTDSNSRGSGSGGDGSESNTMEDDSKASSTHPQEMGDGSKWKPFRPTEHCTGHSAIICSVSWHADNRLMITAAYDNRVILWDVLAQKPKKVYTFPTSVIRAEVNPTNQLRIS